MPTPERRFALTRELAKEFYGYGRCDAAINNRFDSQASLFERCREVSLLASRHFSFTAAVIPRQVSVDPPLRESTVANSWCSYISRFYILRMLCGRVLSS